MGIAAMVLAVSGILVAWSFSRSRTQVAHDAPRTPRSPLDEAERILAARYAAGSITPQEYRRMLTILRT